MQALIVGGLLCVTSPLFASSVVTTTTSLAAIVKELVPDAIKTESLSKINQDPHHLEIGTNHIQMVKGSDIVIAIGFDFESAWLNRLLKTAKPTANVFYLGLKVVNPIPMVGQAGEVKDSHQHHRFNPHFSVSPQAVLSFSGALASELQRVFPKHKKEIAAKYKIFFEKLAEKDKAWGEDFAGLNKKSVITYHESLEYFAKDYNLDIAGRIEVAHGVSPSPLHIKNLLQTIKRKEVSCVLYDSFYSSQQLGQIKKILPTTLKWQKLPSEVGSMPQTLDYFSWLETFVSQVKKCLS